MEVDRLSLERIKEAISRKGLRCPTCKEPIQKFEKYVDMVESIWDGAGDSDARFKGCKVTLICGNGDCTWKERTEYWESYLSGD